MVSKQPTLLDQHGNPISREVLHEPQTARVAHLHQEFAGHPSRGLNPSKLAALLDEAEQGQLQSQSELFEDMEEKDAHILAEMTKRKLALVGLDWDIVPPRNASAAEQRAAAWLHDVIQDVSDFEDVLLTLADGIGKGYACAEIEWVRLGAEWLPKQIHYRPPGWFMTLPTARDTLLLRTASGQGEALRPFQWLTHLHKAKSGYVARGGLLRVLAWPYLFKNYSVRDFAEFLEIYGLPLRLGKYPAGATDKEKSTLLQAVVNIGHNAAGIIPEGMALEITEAAKGAHDPFMAMVEWAERSQSKAILGGTLTSQADGKSSTNALGQVHNEVRKDLLKADARQLAATLTRDLLYPLCALNIGGVTDLRRCPRFVFDTGEADDITAYAEALPKLVGVGMRIPQAYAHERLRIPQPQDGEPVLALAESAAQPSDNAVRLKVNLPTTVITTDAAEKLTAQLAELSAPLLDALLDPVRALVNEAESMDALRDGLIGLLGQLDAQQLAQQMQLAFAAAELAGRFEMNTGN